MKSFKIIKPAKKTKYLFLTIGPGETSQGRALAKFVALKKGNEVLIATRQKNNFVFFSKDKNFKLFLIDSSKKLDNLFKKEKPNVFILCNSKAVRYYEDFFRKPLPNQMVSVSLDSNWLFDEDGGWYGSHQNLDKYFIVFSKKIFNLGLKKYGGNYYIRPEILKRIETVGFIPSYKKISVKEKTKTRKKYGVKKNEKIIFAYFSGWGADHRPWAFDNLINSVEKLINKGLNIKVFYIGPIDNINKSTLQKQWLIFKDKPLKSQDFFLALSSADLIFQHQGLATLSQAISAQIPVINNVMDLKNEKHSNSTHAWEVGPFDKLGLCTMFFRSTSIKKISQEIEKLLYDQKVIKKMKKNQKNHYISGGPNAYKVIQKLLKDKK